jgi:hypothetical protein
VKVEIMKITKMKKGDVLAFRNQEKLTLSRKDKTALFTQEVSMTYFKF